MPSLLSINVLGVKPLQAAALALSKLDKAVQSNISKYLKSEMQPEWKSAVQANARTKIDQAVLSDTAQMTVSGVTGSLQSANRGGKLSGGFPITQQRPYGYGTVEFGTDREKVKTYTMRGRHGRPVQVTRHTARQMPPRVRKGRVVYPAAAGFIPRVASLMVQTVIRTFYDAFEQSSEE
jgi:hypothetical protein